MKRNEQISEAATAYAPFDVASVNSVARAFYDGARWADANPISQWQKFPTDEEGFADSNAIEKIAMPILVRYQDGYVFAVNYDWGEEAEWYNDLLNHPNRYTWLPIPKYEPNKER